MLYEPKEDCFAFRHKFMDGCDALNTLDCKYGNGKPCPFYKPACEVKPHEKKKRRENR